MSNRARFTKISGARTWIKTIRWIFTRKIAFRLKNIYFHTEEERTGLTADLKAWFRYLMTCLD